jgi:hypothetical protein
MKWTAGSLLSENAWLAIKVTNTICDNKTLNGAILQKNSLDTMGMKTIVVSNVAITTTPNNALYNPTNLLFRPFSTAISRKLVSPSIDQPANNTKSPR